MIKNIFYITMCFLINQAIIESDISVDSTLINQAIIESDISVDSTKILSISIDRVAKTITVSPASSTDPDLQSKISLLKYKLEKLSPEEFFKIVERI